MHVVLHQGTVLAHGLEVPNRSTIHGEEVTINQRVFEVTEVHSTGYIPIVSNPFLEPLQIGQFTAWDLQDTSPMTEADTPHEKTRKVATINYMKTVRKQQVEYSRHLQARKTYKKGDTVGVRVHEADRSNTDAKILPCKVAEVKAVASESA